jgi:hypothetical protein
MKKNLLNVGNEVEVFVKIDDERTLVEGTIDVLNTFNADIEIDGEIVKVPYKDIQNIVE